MGVATKVWNKLLLLGSLQTTPLSFWWLRILLDSTADQLYNDLGKINRWHSNEKRALIPILPPIYFNNTAVNQVLQD